MGIVRKFIQNGVYVDCDNFQYLNRHKSSRMLDDYKVSSLSFRMNKKEYYFRNDCIFIWDDDQDIDIADTGLNARASSFNGDFDEFKEYDDWEYDV